jgi:hypothetical protein
LGVSSRRIFSKKTNLQIQSEVSGPRRHTEKRSAKEDAERSVTNDSQRFQKLCPTEVTASIFAQGLNLKEGEHSDQTRWPLFISSGSPVPTVPSLADQSSTPERYNEGNVKRK